MRREKTPRLVERDDIQGIVASGYKHLDHARFVFLKIVDSKAAKNWLSKIVDQITTAKHPGDIKCNSCLNLAVSWQGLDELGVSKLIQDFPYEFVKGMNRDQASLILGDLGDSSPPNWDYGANPAEPLHVLVLLYGKTFVDLRSSYQQICGLSWLNNGLQIVSEQDAFRRADDSTEPFGFRDGISQPPVLGLDGRRQQSEQAINTGEFVLGYENELRSFTRIPSVDNWEDPSGYLPSHPQHPDRRRGFGVNGTYLVFRKLIQKVDDFWAYIDKMSNTDNFRAYIKRTSMDPNNQVHARELLAAKMIGRWRGGSPLVMAPKAPGAEPRNDFLFMTTDPDGEACPLGSHIRRANPRDSLDMPPSRSILMSRRHRIIRRARKFSELAKDSPTNNSKLDQGIYFIALNADLRRQFEFIQQLWINDPSFNGLDNDRDPIAGNNDGKGEFTIQAKPISYHFHGLERFVVTKGGGYFFVPGIRAVRFLANCQP
jgi:Dyp-type peroxidase family